MSVKKPSGVSRLSISLLRQSENSDARPRSHVNLSVDHGGNDELIAAAKVISPARRLVAVIKFAEVRRVKGIQNGWIRIVRCPQDGIVRSEEHTSELQSRRDLV